MDILKICYYTPAEIGSVGTGVLVDREINFVCWYRLELDYGSFGSEFVAPRVRDVFPRRQQRQRRRVWNRNRRDRDKSW